MHTSQMLYLLAQAMYSGKIDIPSYVEMTGDGQQTRADDRSGQQIIDDLIARLEGGES